MASLYPGAVFPSHGLNRRFTRVSVTTTPSEVEDKEDMRVPVNNRSRQKRSQESAVYDVSNSSTRLILLNNKLAHAKMGRSRLRETTGMQAETQKSEPRRHTKLKHKASNYHRLCASLDEIGSPLMYKSSSPKKIQTSFADGPRAPSPANNQIKSSSVVRPKAQRDRPDKRNDNSLVPLPAFLDLPGLSDGQRRYLSFLSEAYNTGDRRRLNEKYLHIWMNAISNGRCSCQNIDTFWTRTVVNKIESSDATGCGDCQTRNNFSRKRRPGTALPFCPCQTRLPTPAVTASSCVNRNFMFQPSDARNRRSLLSLMLDDG